jgi:hypothetical protein
MPRVLGGSEGVGRFLTSEEPLYLQTEKDLRGILFVRKRLSLRPYSRPHGAPGGGTFSYERGTVIGEQSRVKNVVKNLASEAWSEMW